MVQEKHIIDVNVLQCSSVVIFSSKCQRSAF